MAIAKLLIKFGADIREVTSSVGKIESEVGRISKSFANLGSKLVGGASAVALFEIGKSAVAAASKFESSFLKIKNLTDSTAADLGLFKKSLSGISNEVGKPIADLVDGLYSITSSGLSGKEAMDTLRIAAKASAIGMGDVNDIAKSLTATINAYGKENITAEKAMNVFFNTAKLGALDVKDLAPALGKVIPQASAMGISIDQVGAAVAAMSLQGIEASDAVTSLVSIMNAMLTPSEKAKDILGEVGLSMEQVRDVAKNDFSAAINLVSTALGGNSSKIADVLGRVEGLKGFLAISGQNFERYSKIVHETSTEMGNFGKSFNEVGTTSAHKWDVFTAQLANIKLAIGEATIALIYEFLPKSEQGISDLNTAISKIPDSIRQIGESFKKLGPIIENFNNLLNLIGNNKIINFVADLQKSAIGGLLGIKADAETPASRTKNRGDLVQLGLRSKNRGDLVQPIYDGLNKQNEEAKKKLDETLKKLNLVDKTPTAGKAKDDLSGFIPIIEKFHRQFEANVYKPLNQLDNLKGFDGIAIQVTALTRKFQQLKIEREKALSETAFRVTPLESKGDQPRSLAGKVIGAEDNPITQPIEDANKSTKDLLESLGQVGVVLTGIGEASVQTFGQLAAELLTGSLAFKDLGKAALESARSIVKAALAQALAGVISNAIGKFGILGIGIAVAGLALVSSLFKSKVPKLAKGGLAFGPQLAIVGDNPNARTDPEVISPLSKLKGIMAAEVLRLGAILSQAFNASLKNVNFGAGTPSQIKVNIPSISSLLNGIGPIINPSSAFDFAPAPINVNVTGQVFGNDIRLLNDRLGATNNRIKGNKYQ